MNFKATVLSLGLAVVALAGCETANDGYYEGRGGYDGPRVYRVEPDYRYSDRRIPPPYYRDGRRDGYYNDGYDRPRRDRYDGGDYRGDRRDRGEGRDRPDRGQDNRRIQSSERQQNVQPRKAEPVKLRPPREYTPPVRNSAPAGNDRGRGQANQYPDGPNAAVQYCKGVNGQPPQGNCS